MIEMTLREIADVVGGTLHDVPDPAVTVTGSVEFDSRRINPGDLFLALPGARADGHDYATAAVAAGAVAVA
jgi:UDP-N-acetylmuramoyl-tripeptide--D-alanyl-D-alanine ligase